VLVPTIQVRARAVPNIESSKMKVAVVGCGPAGLAAVHAAAGMGANVVIFSPGESSPQKGPLILQRPIPAITNDHPDAYIRQIVIGGSILDYRYKLYGDINISIQGDMLRDGYHCWNHIKAYNRLWNKYMKRGRTNPYITRIDKELDGDELYTMQNEFDLVVNTAPLKNLCYNPTHEFMFKQVEITFGHSYPEQPPDTTIFNAGHEYEWVRSAWLLGNSCTEWLVGTAPPELNPFTIRKPIRHECNCFPRVLGTGRFGAWRNETWVDTAYYDTRDAIMSMQRKSVWDKVK
jgi:hypothetical protein